MAGFYVPERSESSGDQRRPRRRIAFVSTIVATVGALTVSLLPATAAYAAPVYDIAGRWEDDTPETVGRGDVVNAVWNLNVNDDRPAPSNDAVDNVTFTATAANGVFKELPDVCLTADVTPPSAISDDGTTLTCNLGTILQGTAVVVQTPIVADGQTGDQINVVGEINGQTEPLTPIEIQNAFAMDMQFGTNTWFYRWSTGYDAVDLDLQWSLRLATGSDPGPNEVTYRLALSESNGAAITVGSNHNGEVGCTPFNAHIANGHPWSELPGYPADQQTSFVDSCTLTPVAGQPGMFDLTLTGINYDLATVPSKDSAGDALPTDWSYVASGSLWFHVDTNRAGSVTLQSNAPTYQSTTGLSSVDLTANNTTNKTYVLPGGWSAAWWRPATGHGGSQWDDTYRLTRGDTPMQFINYTGSTAPLAPTTQQGQCLVFDTDYVTYTPRPDAPWAQVRAVYPFNPPRDESFSNTPEVQYYIGDAVSDPNTFSCGSDPANWTTTEPADLTQVKAVRIMFPHSIYAAEGVQAIQLNAWTTIKDDVATGQDIWMFGSVFDGTSWVSNATDAQPTPDARYPNTNTRRDILRIVFATPAIQKSGDRSIIKPGEPATFTLRYSANGTGAPETVDDFVITDVLPTGMSYTTGSADPAPAITTNGSGQQVLTWNLDGVPTNAQQALTYQAVASTSVQPGQVLTNTATSTLGGITTPESTAQVTISSSGTTLLGKTTDQWFIPNPDGSGDGEGSWTVTLRSQDPLPQEFTDTIDILPYNGDGRGTSFSGSYEVTAVDVPAGATVYYTDDEPATLSDDPHHVSNGAAPGSVEGNTVGWSTTRPENPTAIRVIGGELAPGATFAFDIDIATDDAQPGDVYMNRAQAVGEHTELVMRTSEPLTMGTMYSASLKKYVQDAAGTWVDANDATTYPTYHVGDEVPYRIVVTNTGQGTLTELTITDSLFPEGSFTVDELAPGVEHIHEFRGTLTDGETVVNTACGTAAIPSDSEVPPTINCDSAGVEVVNYTTVKSSNPASGETVRPGDTIAYTITVTQEGTVPANASFTDTLMNVSDDAVYNDDLTADIGTASLDGDVISWAGTVPVGGTATVTYSVTVKDSAGLVADGDYLVGNEVTSPGCVHECTTEHPIADHPAVKHDEPAPALAVTGGTIAWTAGILAVLMLLAGAVALEIHRRRRSPATFGEPLS